MTSISKLGLAVLAAAVFGAAGSANAADAARGATLFKQRCMACHALTPDTGPRMAPSVAGIANRKAGAAPLFKYSAALKTSGLAWTSANLDQFLTAPKKMVPGTTMSMAVANPTDRADLVAYMATLKK